MRFAGTQLSNFMGGTMDYSNIAGTSAEGRSIERRAVMKGEGMVSNAGVQSLGKIASAEARADAIEAGGQAEGQASMASGLGNMFSGLAKGIGARGRGGSKVKDLSGLDYNDPTNFSFNAAPKYLDKPNIDTSWSGWGSI